MSSKLDNFKGKMHKLTKEDQIKGGKTKIKETKGKTPERTVMAIILRDTHNVFVRMGDGIFGLNNFFHKSTQKEEN